MIVHIDIDMTCVDIIMANIENKLRKKKLWYCGWENPWSPEMSLIVRNKLCPQNLTIKIDIDGCNTNV